MPEPYRDDLTAWFNALEKRVAKLEEQPTPRCDICGRLHPTGKHPKAFPWDVVGGGVFAGLAVLGIIGFIAYMIYTSDFLVFKREHRCVAIEAVEGIDYSLSKTPEGTYIFSSPGKNTPDCYRCDIGLVCKAQ